MLFIDLVAYSKKAVAEQFEIKQRFNGMLAGALELLERRDRVVVDTGDGAAVVFLGDPEDALVVGVAMRGHAAALPMRMGINLGPVKLITDLNDQTNVVGDGINVAQRVMSFAEAGQLLVSANFQDVVSRLSAQYANLFVREGRRQDKHVREHEVWSVSDAIRIQPRESLTDEAPAELNATAVYREPDAGGALPPPAAHLPAKVLDAGPNLMISGASRASVAEAVERLRREGSAVISPITMVGEKWVAACTHPKASSAIKIEEFGLTRVVSSANRQAVEDKVAEYVAFGGRLVSPLEQVDGVWTAVCDTAS